MSFFAECPVCRAPLSPTYFMRTAWSRWRCGECGSLLGINVKRRMLGILPYAALTALLAFTSMRMGMGSWAMLAIIILLAPPVFLFVDRAIVIERAGLRCRGCGYDLQGQKTPRCPECGLELNESERTALQTGVYPQASKRGQSRAAFIMVVILLAAVTATLLLGIYQTRKYPAPTTAAPTTTAPATTPETTP